MKDVRAILFDFDGVLADTEDLHCAAFQTVARSLGAALSREDYHRDYLGLPDKSGLFGKHEIAHQRQLVATAQALS